MFICPQPIRNVLDFRNYHGWKSAEGSVVAYDFAKRCFEGNLLKVITATLGKQHRELAKAKIVKTCFEKFQDWRWRSSDDTSLTHVCAYLQFGNGEKGILQVECKRDEPFQKDEEEKYDDDFCDCKKESSSSPYGDLSLLCEVLGIKKKAAKKVPFLLLYRAAQVICEAYDKKCQTAIFLVHSSSHENEHYKEFRALARALGTIIEKRGKISEPAEIRFTPAYEPYDLYFFKSKKIKFYLGWLKDRHPCDYADYRAKDDTLQYYDYRLA